MLISELIKSLTKFKKQYGDIRCVVETKHSFKDVSPMVNIISDDKVKDEQCINLTHRWNL
jgi:hypothetical protein